MVLSLPAQSSPEFRYPAFRSLTHVGRPERIKPSIPRMDDTDAQLNLIALRGLTAGDRAAARTVYDRYGRIIFSVELKILRNREEAEEATQDVFLALWKNARQLLDTPEKLLPWLLRTARHRGIDRLRRQRSRIATPDSVSEDQANRVVEDTDDETALDSLVDSERATLVQSAVARLPEEQRQAIDLAYFKGMTQSEIADQQHQPLGTVKSRIRYALTRLRQELEGPHAT